MSYGVTFWNVIAKRYAKSPVANEAVYQKKLAATQRYLKPEMKVLEFGCGTGSTALMHAPFVKRYTATDLSPKMLAIAEDKLKNTDIENLEFKVSAIEELPEQEGVYDVILGLSIVHLLYEPDKVFHKVHRLLKPGGLFITSTVCLKGKMSPIMIGALRLGGMVGVLPKLQFFSRAELEQQINRVGFRTEFILPEAEETDSRFMISVKTDT